MFSFTNKKVTGVGGSEVHRNTSMDKSEVIQKIFFHSSGKKIYDFIFSLVKKNKIYIYILSILSCFSLLCI